ncbi:3-beta hydroxysteroid dehydrogenase/isomerase family-domain-containing protein, partial [Lyophyllum atratum]
ASPIHGLPPAIYYKVNEEGTRVVLSACRAAGVRKLVYTSSTGVVWTGADFVGVTEDQVKVPSVGYDAYHHTKALGERLVLDENGKDGMQVVVLRLCGLTGERDKQLIWRLAQALERGQHNVQIGDNTNLIDYLYVGNAAFAHVLAADKLLDEPEAVAGQVFFITNDYPMLQWDFNRLLWSKITGTPTEFNLCNIRFITGIQWYDIEKAKELLGYEPQVTLEEGVRRTAQWWKSSGAAQHKMRKDKSV